MPEAVTLLLRIRRPDGTRTYARPVYAANNKLKPLQALVGGKAEEHLKGLLIEQRCLT